MASAQALLPLQSQGVVIPPWDGARPSALPRPDALSTPALDGVSVVIACRDNAGTVGDAIRAAADAAARISSNYEVIAVDHGSSDDTANLAAAFTASGRFRLLMQARRCGVGSALRTGIAAATMPWVLLVDASAELDLETFDDFLVPANGHDLVTGWRIGRRAPAGERARGALWSWTAGKAAGARVRDVGCPLALIRRDLAARLDLGADDAAIWAEIVCGSHRAQAAVATVGVHQSLDAQGHTTGGGSAPAPGVRGIVRALRAGPSPLDLGAASRRRTGPAATAVRASRGIGRTMLLTLIAIAAVGWLYLIRNVPALAVGPRLSGALPLQQLAGTDGQPLLRVLVAWVPAGLAMGLVLRSLSRPARAFAAALATAVVLIGTGAASDAVTNASPVLTHVSAELARSATWVAVAAAAALALIPGRR